MARAKVHKELCWHNALLLLQEVKSFRSAVKQGLRPCGVTSCPLCGFEPDQNRCFKLHACRERNFLIVHDGVAVVINTALPRWRCPECRRTFTEYPEFAVPYRRYTVPQIRQCAVAYTSIDDHTYRAAVRCGRLPIFHIDPQADQHQVETACDRALAHTSVFHWVTALGTEQQTAELATARVFEPARRKYRSETRRRILVRCYQSVTAADSPPEC